MSKALADRLVACPRFHWLPGMALLGLRARMERGIREPDGYAVREVAFYAAVLMALPA